MIPYQNAKTTAKAIDPKIDTYLDYPDAYVFFNSKAKEHEAEDNEIVVSKETGETTSYAEYIMHTKYWDKEVQAQLVM